MRIGCTGHQGLGALTRRLVVTELARVLEEELTADDSLTGICNLAEGADQLFALVVLAAGGTLQIIIPSESYEASFASRAARDTYSNLSAMAKTKKTLPFSKPSEAAYLAGGRAVVDDSDLLLAVWDGAAAAGSGGTGDVVSYANERGKRTRVLWPDGAQRG